MELENCLSVYEAFKASEENVPNETAIFYFNNKISFSKLLEEIDNTASILQNVFLIKKGDVILVSLPNIPQTIILFYAINKIGAIANMVHPNTPFETMQKYYDDASSKLAFLFDMRVYKDISLYQNFNGAIVLCSAGTYLDVKSKAAFNLKNRKIKKALKNVKRFQFFNNLPTPDTPSDFVPLEKDETSVLLHSASTTGISKTISLGSNAFNFIASRAEELLCMNKEELVGKSMLSVLPSFHGFGLCMTMHLPLANSYGVVLIPKFSAKNVAKMMKKTKNIISFCGVPNVYAALLKEPTFVNNKYLRVLRNCYCGGDSLAPLLKENFDNVLIRGKSRARLYEGYGLTETLAVCCVNTHRHHKRGSIGYPISGAEFIILDDKNKELKPGQIGEICVKSGGNMLSYFNDEEATKATYYNDYLKTGDLGYIDEDGFLYFKARKKRVIKVSGVAIFPHEIEDVIRNLSGVKEACVIQIPDEKTINAAKVYVVSTNKNPGRIINECRRRLISWSIPKEVEFVNSLPMTKLNKVDYRKVQEMEDKKRNI